ncbi:obscurin-like [Ictidomys tridecemlineatus]
MIFRRVPKPWEQPELPSPEAAWPWPGELGLRAGLDITEEPEDLEKLLGEAAASRKRKWSPSRGLFQFPGKCLPLEEPLELGLRQRVKASMAHISRILKGRPEDGALLESNGHLLISSTLKNFQLLTILVVTAEDLGMYTCSVSNPLGTATTTGILQKASGQSPYHADHHTGALKPSHIPENPDIQPLWKSVWRLLKRLGMGPPYDTAMPLLDIYLEELKYSYYSDTCTPMFIAATFTRAKLWTRPRCPSTDGWIKKMWYIPTTEFYSAIHKKEIMAFAGKWIELETILLKEISQTQKVKGSVFSLICGSYRGKRKTKLGGIS